MIKFRVMYLLNLEHRLNLKDEEILRYYKDLQSKKNVKLFNGRRCQYADPLSYYGTDGGLLRRQKGGQKDRMVKYKKGLVPMDEIDMLRSPSGFVNAHHQNIYQKLNNGHQ